MMTLSDALAHRANRPPKRQFPEHVLDHDEFEVICDECKTHFTAFEVPAQGEDPGGWIETDCPECGSGDWEPLT